MSRIQRWSIRRRLLIAFIGVLLPYLLMAGVGAVGFLALWEGFKAIHSEEMKEIRGPVDVQSALLEMLGALEAYVITGDPAERARFEQRAARLRETVAAVESVPVHDPAEQQSRAVMKKAALRVESLGREVLAVAHPRTDRGAREKLREAFALIDEAVTAAKDFHEAALREMTAEMIEHGSAVTQRTMVGFGVAFLVSVAGGIVLALIFADWLSRPLRAIAESSRRMAGGDLSQRIEGDAGGEVGEVARAFNEMAAQVAESRASLEGRIAELAALQKIGADLTSTLHLPAVLGAFAESAVGLIGANRCAVFELNPADQRLHARGSRGMRADQPFMPMRLGQGAVGSAALLRRAVFSPDVHREPLPMYDEEWEGSGKTLREVVRQRGYRSILAVPLISKENVLGAICIYWDEVHAYDEREVRLLTAVAQQAAVAIENARLHEEAQARRRVAEALVAVGRDLAQSLDLVTVGKRITDSIRQLLGVDFSALWRLEPESGHLIGLAASGQTDPIFGSGLALPQGTGLVGFAVRERCLAVSPNLLTDPRVTLTPEMRTRIEQTEFRAVLAIPLVVKERVIGALAAGDREGRVFSREEISLAQAFADQAALALENARLYDEVQAHRSQLTDRVRDLEDALARVKQLQGLLPICAWCKKVRRDQSYWQSVEGYVAEHSEVRFSHGICPDCKEKLLLRRESHG